MDRLLSLIRGRTTVAVRGSAITLQCESSEHALDIIDCIDGTEPNALKVGDRVVCIVDSLQDIALGDIHQIHDIRRDGQLYYRFVGHNGAWYSEQCFRRAYRVDLQPKSKRNGSYSYAIDDGAGQFIAAAKPDEFVYPEFPPEVMEKLLGLNCFTEADIQGYIPPDSKLQIETNVDGHWKITINGEVRGHYSSAKVLAEHFALMVEECDRLRAQLEAINSESPQGTLDAEQDLQPDGCATVDAVTATEAPHKCEDCPIPCGQECINPPLQLREGGWYIDNDQSLHGPAHLDESKSKEYRWNVPFATKPNGNWWCYPDGRCCIGSRRLLREVEPPAKESKSPEALPINDPSKEDITSGGWIAHDGKGRTIPEETLVEFKTRCGMKGSGKAKDYRLWWWWDGLENSPLDIVAYRYMATGQNRFEAIFSDEVQIDNRDRFEAVMKQNSWIKHDGKGMPVEGPRLVQTRHRNGNENTTWIEAYRHGDCWNDDGSPYDITHYRLTGLCVSRRKPHSGPRPRCNECHEKELEKHRARRNKLRQNGCCINCAMPKGQCVCMRKPHVCKYQWDDLADEIAQAVEKAQRDGKGIHFAIRKVLGFYGVRTKRKRPGSGNNE